MSNLANAIALAARAHQKQSRKNGDPYILHPLRLMFSVEGEHERIAAVLHDVVEDTDVTIDHLKAEGFPEAVIEALNLLTHADDVPYDDYIDTVAANPIARRVKIADLEDNMNLRELPEIRDKDLERTRKYHRHWKRLTSIE